MTIVTAMFDSSSIYLNVLPMFSTNLFKIDLDKKEILEQIIPAESGGYGGSLAIISPSNADKPDIIVTVDPKILLISGRTFNNPKCDLGEEYGGCSISIQERNRDYYICTYPSCGRYIHHKCDKSIRGRTVNVKKLCRLHRNLDPVTWKKKETGF